MGPARPDIHGGSSFAPYESAKVGGEVGLVLETVPAVLVFWRVFPDFARIYGSSYFGADASGGRGAASTRVVPVRMCCADRPLTARPKECSDRRLGPGGGARRQIRQAA